MRIEKYKTEHGSFKQHETGNQPVTCTSCLMTHQPVMYKLCSADPSDDTWAELTVNGRKIHDMSTGIAVVRAMGMYTEIKMVTPSGTYYMDTY